VRSTGHRGEGEYSPSWGLFGINQPTIPPPFTAHFSAMTYGLVCDIVSSQCLRAKRLLYSLCGGRRTNVCSNKCEGRIERWKYLGVISSQMQDAAQHCDQFGTFREIVGHEELPQDVHQVLNIHLGGARVKLSLPHQRHLEIADTVLKRDYLGQRSTGGEECQVNIQDTFIIGHCGDGIRILYGCPPARH
jgi:hypothetical protein